MTIMEMGPAPETSLHQDTELSDGTFTIPNVPTNPLECMYTGITHRNLPSHETRHEIEKAKLAAAEKYGRTSPEDIDFGRAALALCAGTIIDHKRAARVAQDAPLEFAQPIPRQELSADSTHMQPYSENPSAYFDKDAA